MNDVPKGGSSTPAGRPRPTCRTRRFSPYIAAFGDCLAPGPHDCSYVAQYGGRALCFHTRWQDFVEAPPRTR